jgi:hypothetical protein
MKFSIKSSIQYNLNGVYMKNRLIVLFILAFTQISFAQFLNSASVLRPGKFVLRTNGVVYTNPSDFQFNFNGGIGITGRMDLEARVGFGAGDTYFGLDLEYLLSGSRSTNVSLFGGFHTWIDFGLDFGLILSTKLTRSVLFTVGLDFDVEFIENNNMFAPYLNIGTEIPFQKNLSLNIEGDIKLADDGNSKMAFGLNIYF